MDYVGLLEEMIERIEKGTTPPDFDTVYFIVQFLGIEIDLGWLRLITDITHLS